MNIKIKSKFTFPFSPLPFHIAIIITPILLTIIACSPITEISKGNLSGVIALEGMEDNSAIIVAIYDLAYLDTTIVRINQEYPQIGVIITQSTEFDHRLQTPLYTTETAADGSFELEKIPTGIYNFVAQKENFGFRYIYEISISEGENSLSEMGKVKSEKDFSHLPFHFSQSSARSPLSQRDNRSILSDITLYAEHHISGIISDDIYLAPFHHLVIDSDTEFIPGTNFTIMPNAVVRINPGQDLIIYGNLTAQGEEYNMFWVTSNAGFEVKGNGKWEKGKNPSHFSPFTFHTKRDSLALYNSMQLSPVASVTDDLIEWGKWSLGNTCLLNQVDNLHLQDGIFRDGECGFYSANVEDVNCNNLIVYNCDNENEAGLSFQDVTNGIVERSIFYNCNNGSKVQEGNENKILNTYYFSNKNAILNFGGIEKIEHNLFINNYIDIELYGSYDLEYQDLQINYNELYSPVGINTDYLAYYDNYSSTLCSYNNLNNDDWFVYIGHDIYAGEIVCENNYYEGLSDINLIEDGIYDSNDNEDYIVDVIVNNILLYEVNGAGIE